MRARDVVEIRGLEVSCIVGVYPQERDTPQPLVVSLALALDTRAAAAREELAATVDYGRLSGDVRFLLEHCRFALIESAAEVLARYALLAPLGDRPRVTHVRVCIEKPRALTGGAIASVCVERDAGDFLPDVLEHDWGFSDRVFVGRDCVVERRRIAARRTLGPMTHDRGEAHELITTHGVASCQRALAPGVAFSFPSGRARRYDAGEQEQALLCVHAAGAADVMLPSDVDVTLPRATLYDAPAALAVAS